MCDCMDMILWKDLRDMALELSFIVQRKKWLMHKLVSLALLKMI